MHAQVHSYIYSSYEHHNHCFHMTFYFPRTKTKLLKAVVSHYRDYQEPCFWVLALKPTGITYNLHRVKYLRSATTYIRLV